MAEVASKNIVECLCSGASEGMLKAAEEFDAVSVNEVFSAHMTMALRAVVYARDIGGDMNAIRGALEKIWAELPQETIM